MVLAMPGYAQDFEIDHNGNWILRGVIRCGKAERKVRWIIDTGSEVSLLDVSLKDALGLRPFGKAAVTDLGQASRQLEVVEADAIVLGPHRILSPKVLLADIHGRFRGATDVPIDGLLGMDVLKHLAFRWDEASKTFHWGLGDLSQYDQSIPIEFVKNLPCLPILLGEKAEMALLDTGAIGGGFILPMEMGNGAGPGESRSIFGNLSFAEGSFKGRIQLGAATWTDPQVLFVKQNTGKVLLGNRLFRNHRFAVDFNQGKFHLRTGSEPKNMKVPDPRRLKLALRWDDQRRLVIVGMKPGGPFEQAGFRPGDRLVRLGDLQGAALTIQTAYDFLDDRAMVQAVVWRDGKELALSVP